MGRKWSKGHENDIKTVFDVVAIAMGAKVIGQYKWTFITAWLLSKRELVKYLVGLSWPKPKAILTYLRIGKCMRERNLITLSKREIL